MERAAATENQIFLALADPSRRTIFASLTRGEAAVECAFPRLLGGARRSPCVRLLEKMDE